jgi:hypothetical protein
MANDRTRNQINRVTEAAVEATKADAHANADVARKGAETTKRAVEANVEAATRANADVAGKGAKTAQRAVEASVEQADQTARKGIEVAQRTIDASADRARHTAEASVQEIQRGLDRSSRQISTAANQATRAAREGTQRTSENLGVAMQVVTTAASGYQSVVTELVEQSQQAFKRNVDTFNQALRVRNATDLLNVQTRYLHDSLGAVLNTSARISEISAETAAEAAGKLQQRQSA